MKRRTLVASLAVALLAAISCTTTDVPGLAGHAGTTPRALEGSVAGPPGTPPTILVWTPSGVWPRLETEIAELTGVARTVSVRSGTVWLTASFDADGRRVDRPPAGLSIPVEVAAADPARYAPFVGSSDAKLVEGVAAGGALLGRTSASLRHIADGGTIVIRGHRLPVVGVVPDEAIGAHEVFVSLATAAALGVERSRYLLVRPSPAFSPQLLADGIRTFLTGTQARVRIAGETPYLRHADAVPPQVQLKRLFGEFAARPLSTGFLRMDPAWEADHIATATVPVLGTVRCNSGVIPQLRGALAQIQREGLAGRIDARDFGGCYSARFVLARETAGISHHAWGVAVDINVSTNAFGAKPHQDPRVVAIFERWGFGWGGDWLVPDGMHFEFREFPGAH